MNQPHRNSRKADSNNWKQQPDPRALLALLITQGAIFYCSTSGGKDSQAMTILLKRIVPADQLVLVHADLGEMEWRGVQDHIIATAGLELNVVRAQYASSGRLSPGVAPGSRKTLLVEVARKASVKPDSPSWPSSAARWCTSDLKRNPIAKFIRNDLKARGKLIAVNCMGIRAEESKSRAKKIREEMSGGWKLNAPLSKAGREVWDWYPLAEWSTKMVFAEIKRAGQPPHPAYAGGNDRLSCMFCILGSKNDLRHAARVNPQLAEKYIALEAKTGFTMFDGKSLADIITTDGEL